MATRMEMSSANLSVDLMVMHLALLTGTKLVQRMEYCLEKLMGAMKVMSSEYSSDC